MKISSLSLAAAALALAALASASSAQTPQTPPSAAAPRPPRTYPAPTNLKVLPKELTGQQVHEIMEKWEGELGAHCNSCHTADPTNLGPNGKPRLKFEDDSKDEKVVARLMYTMSQEMNQKYFGVMKHDEAEHKAVSVTCGTCHRGHMHPEEFVPAKEDRPMGPMPGMQMPVAPAVPGQK